MKVGIYGIYQAPDQIPTGGGGYTYQHNIFHCFSNLRSESRHDFAVLGWGKEPHEEIKSRGIPYVSLTPAPEGFLRFARRAVNRLRRTPRLILNRLRRRQAAVEKGTGIEKMLAAHGIEMIWYMTPWFVLTYDVPYITLVWDLQHRLQPYFPEVSSKGEWKLREDIWGQFLRRATIVITGTEVGKAELEKFYQLHSERIKVLPMPVPKFATEGTTGNATKVLAKYHLPGGFLLYPAQFWPHKNHTGLLLAVKILRDQYQLTFPVVLVGSNQGNEPHIKRLTAELGLTELVHFLGFVPKEDLVLLYQNAFALTYLSFFGPDNLPPLEAFALSCPVIAAEVAGAREQLGEAALLVDPKDPVQAARAIKLLHDDPALRRSMIEKGLAQITNKTTEGYVRGIFALLDEFEPLRRCWSNREPLEAI